MTRAGRYTPDNPWQRATALGRRLRVTGLDALGAMWSHPDLPLAYTVHLEPGRWRIFGANVDETLAAGVMDEATARQYVENRRSADARRLAAAAMLRHLESVPA